MTEPAQSPEGQTESARRGDGGERAHLVRRAGVVGAGTLASRLLGLGRDIILAKEFDRQLTDAFFVAFTIPNALRQLLGEGAVSSAVVPVLAAKVDQGEEQAREAFARIRGLSLLALLVVTVLGIAFAEPLAHLFAGGYRTDPVQFARVVSETRLVFPYIFFMGSAALGMAALHTHRRFAVASFAPTLLNVAMIACAWLLPPVFERYGIDKGQVLVTGALIGGLLQVVAQWPALRAIGYLTAPRFDLKDPAVRDVLRRIAPMTVGIGVYYIDLVLSRRFLSELGPGAQSYFTWASRICDFPQGIFVLALSTAALPTLSSLAAKGDRRELLETYAHGLRLSLFVAIPCSVALAVLAEPIVVMFFQRGAFEFRDSVQTARALALQGSAVWTVAVVRQAVALFHASGDTRTPVVVSALDLVVFIALALALRGRLGHAGISLAIAGSSYAQMALLLGGLRRRFGQSGVSLVASSVVRTIASSVAGAGAGLLTANALARGLPDSAMFRLVPGLAGCGAFGVAFLLVARTVKSEELGALFGGLSRRFRRSRPSQTSAPTL